LAACGQSPITTQATNVNGPATAVASTPATPGIEESEASRQIRAAKAAETYMPKSYDNYPAYLRYWAHAFDLNDVLCFGGNSDIETTRKNCTDRDGM
ncbi:hypothetical protein, partial [Enterococcus faecium]|uniref:hypothetical protein n=1 Tax=Enterococcus faecium TaxID=1352 RepID=UPI003F51F908